MFRHRRHLHRWAYRVLVVWLFGIAAGVANACLVADFAREDRQPLAAATVVDEMTPRGDDSTRGQASSRLTSGAEHERPGARGFPGSGELPGLLRQVECFDSDREGSRGRCGWPWAASSGTPGGRADSGFAPGSLLDTWPRRRARAADHDRADALGAIARTHARCAPMAGAVSDDALSSCTAWPVRVRAAQAIPQSRSSLPMPLSDTPTGARMSPGATS